MGTEIPKEVSLRILDNIIADEGQFSPWNDFSQLEIMEIKGYSAEFTDLGYKNYFKARIQERIDFLIKESYPEEAIEALKKLLREIV